MTENVNELLSKGIKSFKEGKFETAEKFFKSAVKIEPKSALVHNNYAMLLKRMEQYENAEKHYKAALLIDPKNVQIQKNYGNLLKKKIELKKNKEEKSSPGD